jgi:hypothetical protein
LILSLRLRPIHRPVGIPDQILRPFVQIGAQRDPNARPEHDWFSDVDRLLEFRQDTLANANRVGRAGQVMDQHRKLVAAIAGHDVLFSHTGLELPGRMPQHHIARLVSKSVVDGLESVQIDEQNGELEVPVDAAALDCERTNEAKAAFEGSRAVDSLGPRN